MQCIALTKNNTRCKNKVKDGNLCYKHINSQNTENKEDVKNTENKEDVKNTENKKIIKLNRIEIKTNNENSFTEFRKNIINSERIKNLNLFYKNLIDGSLKKEDYIKINNRYNLYQILFTSFEEYLNYLKSNIINNIGLEKDPSKQNIDEKIQIQYYNLKYNKNIQKLYNRSYCLDLKDINNIKISESTNDLKHNLGERTKSFDAIDPDTNELFIIKYTENSGGAQDNQIKDVQIFLQYCKLYNLQQSNIYEKRLFTAILSGTYMKKMIKGFKEFYSDDFIKIVFLE
jgi:hypothetical protein